MNIANVRVAVPEGAVDHRGPVKKFFDILQSNTGLTEEFLYHHQPSSSDVVEVYSTNPVAVGRIDYSCALAEGVNVLSGPLIIVARKGYAGRTFMVDDERVAVHEDGYAIRPKPEYENAIRLGWFADHYSNEFQSYRTSEDGIGDFPRALLLTRNIIIPTVEFQDRVAAAYRRRSALVSRIKMLPSDLSASLDDALAKA